MEKKIKSGRDYTAGVQLYFCQTYDDIADIPRKTFGDRFRVLEGDHHMYIVDSTGEVVPASEAVSNFDL